ncbi:MAG TPA: type II secretion system protein [Pyrinomonadaceae bacterium]|jgi:prepilin-type N-terminal cleavage/methylation domain-containing protein
MKKTRNIENKGFSLIELMIAMTITLALMGVATTLFSGALGIRTRESRRADALSSARAALSSLSREISNSGYGLTSNGIVTADSNNKKIHFRANLSNDDYTTDSIGEDVTYFFDDETKSIVRYDPNNEQTTSVIVNRISDVTFTYYDYVGGSSAASAPLNAPTGNTGRVTITVMVELEDVAGQPKDQTVTFTSDVTLRNSSYMLNQY